MQEFNPVPIASASIGQVHLGTLKNGQRVAVKVKRPSIEEEITTDFQVLLGFISFLRRFSDQRELYELETIFKQYNSLLYEEIDFKKEVQNMITFRKMFSADETRGWIAIPKTYPLVSNNNIIIMEYVPSIKINDVDTLTNINFNTKRIAKKLIECYIIQVTQYGLVHIDPHPGNVGITKAGKIVFYDYGMVTKINSVLIEKFQELLYAVTEKDCDKIAQIMVESDIVSVEPENMIYLKSFVLSFLNYLDTVNVEYFKENFIDKLNATELPFLINSNFLLLLRGLTILEGICKTLDPEFNYSEVINSYMNTFPFDIQYFENRAIRDIASLRQLGVTEMIDKSVKSDIDAELLEKRMKELAIKKSNIEQKQNTFNVLVVAFLCLLGFEVDVIQHNFVLQMGLVCITFLSVYSK